MEVHLEGKKRVLFRDDCEMIPSSGVSHSPLSINNPHPKHPKFHSQPLPKGTALSDAVASEKFSARPVYSLRIPVGGNLTDRRYNSFKTWSGKLERQLSHLRGRVDETEIDLPQTNEMENIPAYRYFDALEGPELDTLKGMLASGMIFTFM